MILQRVTSSASASARGARGARGGPRPGQRLFTVAFVIACLGEAPPLNLNGKKLTKRFPKMLILNRTQRKLQDMLNRKS